MHEECTVVKTITVEPRGLRDPGQTQAQKRLDFPESSRSSFGRRRTGRPNTRYSRLTPSVTPACRARPAAGSATGTDEQSGRICRCRPSPESAHFASFSTATRVRSRHMFTLSRRGKWRNSGWNRDLGVIGAIFRFRIAGYRAYRLGEPGAVLGGLE